MDARRWTSPLLTAVWILLASGVLWLFVSYRVADESRMFGGTTLVLARVAASVTYPAGLPLLLLVAAAFVATATYLSPRLSTTRPAAIGVLVLAAVTQLLAIPALMETDSNGGANFVISILSGVAVAVAAELLALTALRPVSEPDRPVHVPPPSPFGAPRDPRTTHEPQMPFGQRPN